MSVKREAMEFVARRLWFSLAYVHQDSLTGADEFTEADRRLLDARWEHPGVRDFLDTSENLRHPGPGGPASA